MRRHKRHGTYLCGECGRQGHNSRSCGLPNLIDADLRKEYAQIMAPTWAALDWLAQSPTSPLAEDAFWALMWTEHAPKVRDPERRAIRRALGVFDVANLDDSEAYSQPMEMECVTFDAGWLPVAG